MSTKIQNKNASVENENLVAINKNEVVQNATLTIFALKFQGQLLVLTNYLDIIRNSIENNNE
jgi:hypothetical protein